MTSTAGASSRVLTVPNLISFLRLVLVPVFAVLLIRRQDGWALAVLAFSGASDWLDGVIARRWNQVSRLGQLLDPAADRAFILVTVITLAWRAVVPWWLVVALVARDVLLGVVQLVVARGGHPPLPVHLAGKSGTFALLYALPLLLLGQWHGPVPTVATVLGWAFAIWGLALYWFSGVLYARQARQVLAGPAGEPALGAKGA